MGPSWLKRKRPSVQRNALKMIRKICRRRAEESAETTCPPRNETVTVSSSPSTVSVPLLRWRPSTWKMSVREKTRRVPSRPMGTFPGREVGGRPDEEGRQQPDDGGAAPLVFGRKLPWVEVRFPDHDQGDGK